MKIVVSSRAKRDLFGIYLYISRENPQAALNVIERIDGRLTQLSRFPFIGRQRPSLGRDVRSLLADNYSIFYTVAAEEITVLRVIDGRMDIDQEFRR